MMRKPFRSLTAICLALSIGGACKSSTTPQPVPPPPPRGDVNDAPARPPLTEEQCAAQGGTVVGDIGDGAIHRSDYTCPGGSTPIGRISATPGAPMAVEGAVCCPV